jgi:very-short-patch-repair endonuclease
MKNWNVELVLESASHYKKRSDWKKNESGAYKAALRFGCMAEATEHMPIIKRDLTYEELHESALKYQNRGSWKVAEPSVYKTARIRGLLEDICSHMIEGKRVNGTWTKENVLASARKFNSIAAWSSEEVSAYNVAKKNGWMTEATSHMSSLAMPIGPSTIHKYLLSQNIKYIAEYRFKEDKSIASKPFDFYLPTLNLIIEFHGKQHQRGWRDDEKSRLEIQRNDLQKRSWAFENGYDFLEIKSWESKTEFDIINRLKEAIVISAKKMNMVLTEIGRELTRKELNKIQSGFAFTADEIFNEALKYKTRSEWMKKSPKTYRFALRHGLASEATSSMEYVTEHGKWTKETILSSAMKYKSYSEWRKGEASAYVISRRLNCGDLVKAYFSQN